MNTREAVSKRINQLCNDKGITPNGISNISAVPQSTVKSILNGESKNPGIVTPRSSATDSISLSVNSFPHRISTIWNKRSGKELLL